MIKKVKFLAPLLVFALMFTMVVPTPTFAANVATQSQEKDCECSSKDVDGKKVYSNSDADIDILLEIVESDLEEKAVINKDGTVSNYYSSATEAGVSEKAFQEFEKMLEKVNTDVKAGIIQFGNSLFDYTVKDPEVAAQAYYCFSDSQVQKALKVIRAGGAVAAVAAALGYVPAWVAAGFVALAAIGDLCNWNNNGMCILFVGTQPMSCIPL